MRSRVVGGGREMSTIDAGIGVDAGDVYPAEIYVALLILADVALTQAAAVQGPATEVGLGAVHLIAGAGWPGLLAAQVLVAGVALGVARAVAERDLELGASIRGFVAGFWVFTVVSNLAVAVQAGVLP